MTTPTKRGQLWWLLCAAVVAAFAAVLHLQRSPASFGETANSNASNSNNNGNSNSNNNGNGNSNIGRRSSHVCGVNAVDTQPSLAIVIVTYKRLLQSVANQSLHDEQGSAEVIVIDNGCLPETRAVVQERCSGARYIAQCSNIGYARANNLGAEQASPSVEWLLLLNDDTRLHSGFLHNMHLLWHLFEQGLNRTVGAMGCKSVWPDGRLVEAGSAVYRNGWTDNYGRRDAPTLPQYSHTRSVHYTSGACLMIRRLLYIELGGMRADIYKAYYEDTDLAMSIIHKRGLPVIYNPYAVMLHDEHASFGAVAATQLMEQSRATFVSQWGRPLTLYHPAVPNAADFPGTDYADTARFLHARHARSAGRPITYHALFIVQASALEPTARLLFSIQHVHPDQLTSLVVVQTALATELQNSEPLTTALRAAGVEVFWTDQHNVVEHIESRKLFYQVLCTPETNITELRISPATLEQHGIRLPLFRFSANMRPEAIPELTSELQPSLLKSLPNNKELAYSLLRSQRYAIQSFPAHMRDAAAFQVEHAEEVDKWFSTLQDGVVGIQAPQAM